MASFAFDTITSAEALQFSGADTLTFTSGSAAHASVDFLSGEGGEVERVAVTLQGRTVVFGAGIAGVTDREVLRFADGSSLLVGDNRSQVLAGGFGADGLFGGGGEDFLLGWDGDDLLHGNAGHDTLEGGTGSNIIYGGQGEDLIRASSGGETRGSWAHGNKGDDEVIGGVGADTLYGGQGDDVLAGDAGDDFLSGDLGDDEIQTGSGDDLGTGGAGNDTLISVDGADVLRGGDGADRLASYGHGRAMLEGGDGADTIVAASHDQAMLYGGEGADLFEILGPGALAPDKVDHILDWERLDRLGFGGARGEILPHQYAELHADSRAGALDGAVGLMRSLGAHRVAAQVGGDVWVFADTNGDSFDGPEMAVLLVGRSLTDIDWMNFA